MLTSRRPASPPWARAALLAAAVLAAPVASAQDTHYWNLQYGPVAELLGGIVVGNAIDLSSTYYNPGGLALAEGPAFLLSLNSFQLEQLRLEADREIFDLSSSRFGSAPSLLAGKLPGIGQSRLAWSFLRRQESKLRVSSRRVAEVGDGPTRVGAEDLVDENLTEDWGGVTWSRRVAQGVAVAASLYGVYRSQRLRDEISGQAAAPDGSGGALLTVDAFDYHHARMLMKFGVSMDVRPLRIGPAATTRSLSLFGSGKGGFTRSLTGVDLDRGGLADNSLSNAFEQDLVSDYRSPWSVALGAAYGLGSSRIHVSGEWFDSVDRFSVIDPAPFLGDDADEHFVAG